MEADEGAYHLGEKLEEVGDVPTEELTEETNMSEEEAGQQLGDETAELEPAAGWKYNATKEEERNMGVQDDLPTDKEELKQRILHKKSQPLEQLDRVIEEIRKLMLRSVEEINKGNMTRGEPAIAVGKKHNKKQQQQKQHSWRGSRGQLQGKFWDPGGFQH